MIVALCVGLDLYHAVLALQLTESGIAVSLWNEMVICECARNEMSSRSDERRNSAQKRSGSNNARYEDRTERFQGAREWKNWVKLAPRNSRWRRLVSVAVVSTRRLRKVERRGRKKKLRREAWRRQELIEDAGQSGITPPRCPVMAAW